MPLDLHGVDQLPTEYYGGEIVSEDTSMLISYTANNVCTTCDFTELCKNNGVRGIYIRCQHPQSPYGSHTHNALQDCKFHTRKTLATPSSLR